MSSARFQRSGERPRSVREITADVDPETPVRLGESRYHSAVELPSGEIVTLRCADIDAPGSQLSEAAARGLRPCKSCQPPEYLADPDTEDVPENRSASSLRADLDRLTAGDTAGLSWTTHSGNPVTVEGTWCPATDANELGRLDPDTRPSNLLVRPHSTGRPHVYAALDAGEKRLGELVDVLVIETTSDQPERELVTDGGDDSADESPGHASAVAETLRQADDEDLEAAGIDPDAVDDDPEVADDE